MLRGWCVVAFDGEVWPLFGPQAGGTLIILTGSELMELLEQPAIVLISSNSHDIITLSTNATRQ